MDDDPPDQKSADDIYESLSDAERKALDATIPGREASEALASAEKKPVAERSIFDF
jgi:hypothetical protein